MRMTTKKNDVTKRRSPSACRHPQHYETDWLGRTYVGCPICDRWKRNEGQISARGRQTSGGVNNSGARRRFLAPVFYSP